MERELELVEVTEDHAFLLDGPVACVIWRGRMTVESTEGTEALGSRALERSPRGAGLLFFAEATAPPRHLRQIATDVNTRLVARGAVGVAGVFLDRGLLGIAQRGIARGMALLSGHSYPFEVFSDTRRACDWLGRKLEPRGIAIAPEEVAADLDAFRRDYLAHGATMGALAADGL